MKQAVVLAGGKGTRLRSALGDKPKPLAEIGNDTLLGHQLALLCRYGVEKALILVNHGAEQIADWLAARDYSPMQIRLIDDGEPKGTAGAVLAVFDQLAENFLVLYADTMIGVDLARFWKFHSAVETTSASLFLHPNDHPADSDLVEIDDDDRIDRFHAYPHPEGAWLPNLVNAALYIVRKDALREWKTSTAPLDFAKHLFPQMLERGYLLRGYNSPEYIKDAGTPARLEKVRNAYSNGVVQRASLSVQQKAVFIDRDGTLNVENGYIRRAEDLELFPNVGKSIHRLNEKEWRSIVVTNQPVISRGEASVNELRRIHARLDTEIAQHGAFIDRLYYCPHHPDSGFAGEVRELKVKCDCRKPAPGLLFRAARDLNISLVESWMVGDSTVDLAAAESAGTSAILVETGCAGFDDRTAYQASFTQKDFAAAVEFIVEAYPKLQERCAPLLASATQWKSIFVGGLARTGKSTLAGTLVRELRRAGRKAHVLSLDRWLKDYDKRGTGVWSRYDLDAIESVIRRLIAFQASEAEMLQLELPAYNRNTRMRSGKTLILNLTRQDCVVIEGVPALEIARRVGRLDRSIYLTTDESLRRERFHSYDRARGIPAELSDATFTVREKDERPYVEIAAANAQINFCIDDVFGVKVQELAQ